jgi:translation initiation factor 3 subunit C
MNEAEPISFFRCISNLEEFLNQSVAAGKGKKMKAPNAKAMNGMKSKLKKAIKDHDTEISKFRSVSRHSEMEPGIA